MKVKSIDEIIIVLAGNYEQFKNWDNQMEKHPAIIFKYACRREDILGIHGAYVLRVGEYWLNPLDKIVADRLP